MKENLNRLIKNQATLNVEGLLFKKDGSSFNVRCRKRPILNEILKCTGISYLCEDITETKIWKQKLSTYASHDFLIGDILNEEAFTQRLEHDFNRAKRYNQPFAMLVIELKDIYDFANKGISFETGDTILKNAAEYCVTTFKIPIPISDVSTRPKSALFSAAATAKKRPKARRCFINRSSSKFAD